MAAPSPRPRGPQLRPATPADREFLCRLYASTRADELAVVDWPPEVVDAFLRQQFDARDHHYRNAYPTATDDLILVEGQRAGHVCLVAWAEETRIVDIALLPQYRGRGVGTRVLGDVLATARARGVVASIHVERHNPALRWYQRLGFEVAEDKGVYLLLRWQPPTEVL